ncbi:hypothetical protein D3C71_1252580 [compost metagenome]
MGIVWYNKGRSKLHPVTDNHCLFNKFRFNELGFDRLWYDVLPARNFEHLFFSVNDFQEFFIFPLSNISGMQPSINDGFIRFGLVLIVSHHDIRAFY